MKNIVLARVDDRLIHGQVVSRWIPFCQANQLLIIDDESAKNKLVRRVMSSTAPAGMEFHLLSVAKGAEFLQEDSGNKKEKILLLVKSISTIRALMETGCDFTSVNLGGMGMYGDRKPYFRNISCNEEEVESIDFIHDQGTEIYYQLVPEQKRFTYAEFTK